MEDEWYADRARLRCAVRDHPEWSGARLARELGRSLNWVKKWRRRLAGVPPDDEAVLRSRSRARTRPPPTVPRPAVERLLAIRDEPPAGLQRVPGPKAIVYFLQRDAELQAGGVAPPRSTSTVWRILRGNGRIAQRRPHHHEPVELPPPLASWQLDVKDVSTVPGAPDEKRQHAVEALNCVDCGTSLLVAADVRPDFTGETTRAAVADLLREHGLPGEVTVDRDPLRRRARRGRLPVPARALPDLPGRRGPRQPAPPTRPQRLRNGRYAMDKFCLTRTGRLRLSWSRRSPPSDPVGPPYPSRPGVAPRKEGTDGQAAATVGRRAAVQPGRRRLGALGPRRPAPADTSGRARTRPGAGGPV